MVEMLNNKITNATEPSVSIIILNYNGKIYLEGCINSLKKIDYTNYEILLADNNSSDDSIEYVQKEFPFVNVIVFDNNYGYAQGNNMAAKYVTSKYVLFLNPDTLVEPNWLNELIKVAETDDKIAACGGKVLSLQNKNYIQNIGHVACIHGGGYALGFGELNTNDTYNKPRYILGPSGCSMLVRREIFLMIGGFDPDYFMYVEEFDFGIRLWIYGYKAIYVPDSVVYHRDLSDYNKLLVYYSHRNRIFTIIKNFELLNIIKGLLANMIYSLIRIKNYCFNGRYDLVFTMISGQINAFLNISKYIKKRNTIQHFRSVNDKYLFDKGILTSFNGMYYEYTRLQNTKKHDENIKNH
jgi:GT2 family glycosyltransferase